jgi:hypothetical protein
MSSGKRIYLPMLLPVALWLGAPADAQAYLDPGTGSILLQGLIASTATAIMILRGRWKRVRDFLLGKSRNITPESDDRDDR